MIRGRGAAPLAAPVVALLIGLFLAPGAVHGQWRQSASGRNRSVAASRTGTFGWSAERRPIGFRRDGSPDATFKVLAVGQIHGNERQGIRVIRRVQQLVRPAARRFQLVTVRTVNPDGLRRRTRKNARGVDLNRYFPFHFDPGLSGGYESGPGPASEPETRAVMRLARRERFDLAIWYHQPWGVTLVPCNGTGRVAKLYARLSGLHRRPGCDYYSAGSAISWLHHAFRTSAFVVELPGRPLRPTEVNRHARAILRLAGRLSPDSAVPFR